MRPNHGVLKTRALSLIGIVALTLALWPALVMAGTTGKISGVVTDQQTGQPIGGALVTVVGTDLTARTDAEGRYTILHIPVGKYTIVASMLGEDATPAETELLLFQPIEVQDLKVSVDLSTEQNIALSSRTVEMGTIVVIAERPAVLRDRTASMRIVESEQIQSLPTRGYRDLVALEPGVVVRPASQRVQSASGDQLNVRGGRSSEVAYFVDGFSQQDPLSGMSTTQINNNDLEEVSIVTGGFNAEYGWVASGAVNVTTKEGTDKLAGTLESVSDNFHSGSFDYNVYDASLSGPLVGLTDKIRFIASGERRWQGDRTPAATSGGPRPNNRLAGWTWRGKANWKLAKSAELKFGALTSDDDWQLWQDSWRFDLAHAPRFADRNRSEYATLEHVLGPHTFYSASVSHFMTERKRGDGVLFDNIWAYGRPGTHPEFDDEQLFHSWDDINGPTPIVDTVIDGRTYPVRGDEAAIFDSYQHRKSSYLGFNFDLTSQVNPHHEVHAGVDVQSHTLRRYQHLSPSRVWEGYGQDEHGFDDVDRYGYSITGEQEENGGLNGAKHPLTLATFVQDKFELQGLVINAGLRLDYLNVNTKRLRDELSPLDPDHYSDSSHVTDEQRQLAQTLDPGDLVNSRAEIELSPRLGLAFPVSDRSVFHVSYGHFVQRPDLQNLYVNYQFLEYKIKNGGYFFPFGNPNLRPEHTTAYEVGWTRQVGERASVDVTAYYKDVKDLTEVVNVPASPNSFSTFHNADFGTIKGVEFSFDMRRTRNITTRVSYSLSQATGTGSNPLTQQNIAWQGGEIPKTANPLDFDQRHKFVGIFDVHANDHEGPKVGGSYIFANSGINATFQAASGFPFTPTKVYNELTLTSIGRTVDGAVNSRYSGWRMQLDLKATKTFHVAGSQLEFELWVINLLNRHNALLVYQSSGLPNSSGWLETPDGQRLRDTYSEPHDSSQLTAEQKYLLREQDPNNFDTPRQIRAGLKFSF
ncbi:MAG: TonB-dependent receptor [candidate division Zixibacteria bacterium]|nr:TonB-dependent receptor [candidate division Zixibacteria bacterium]